MIEITESMSDEEIMEELATRISGELKKQMIIDREDFLDFEELKSRFLMGRVKDGEKIFHLLSDPTNPEEILIREERWKELSEEAATVCRIILNFSPYDWRRGTIIDIWVRSGADRVSKGKLKAVLRQMGWKYREIEKVFKEISLFVKTFN